MQFHRDPGKSEGAQESFRWTFLHGLGDGASSAAPLRELFRAVGDEVDVPNLSDAWARGKSGRLASDRLADGLLSSPVGPDMQKVCSRSHFLVCHSAGALVGLALEKRGARFNGLAFVEGSLRAADGVAIGRYVDPRGADWGRRRLIDDLENSPVQADNRTVYLENVLKTNPDMFREMATELVDCQEVAWTRLSRVRIPILYIAGALSPGSSSEELRPLREMSGITVIVIPNAAHWVHVDAPEVVFSHLRSWACNAR